MSALFGSGGRSSGPKPLVEFRAGKMMMKGNMVHPDKRKGLVFIEQGDDQLMHFKWKDRSTGTVEDDLIIFPDDIEFKRVSACSTGRVFLLKFKVSSRRLFYWMQEPKTDKDEELGKKVNDYLNNPSSIHSSSGGGGGSGGGGAGRGSSISGLDLNNIQDTELQSLLSNMSQQQLVNLFSVPAGSGISSFLNGMASSNRQRSGTNRSSSSRGSTAATTTTTTANTTTNTTTTTNKASSNESSTTAAGANKNEWSSIKVPEGAAAATEGPTVDLSSSINAEVLQPLLENKEFVDKMKGFLPKDTDEEKAVTPAVDPASDIKGTVQSPQFQQALSVFSTALQSGQMAPLVREFNLGDEAVEAATQGNMEQFIKALQKSKTTTPEGGDEDESEKMMTE